jgi:O-antigen/teichoic acid export membrane protein
VPEGTGERHDLFGRRLLYVLISSAPLVSGALVSPVLAYTLGPSSFGQLATAIALHQVLIVIAVLGLDHSLSLHHAEDGPLRARALVTVGALFSVLTTAVVFVTGPLWASAIGFDGLSSLVVAAVLWTAPGAIALMAMALLSTEDRLWSYAWVSALSTVGGQVVGIALLFGVGRTAATYAWGGVASQVAAMLLGLALVRPRLRGAFDRELVRRAVVLGVPLTAGALSLFLLNAGDRIIIQSQLGPVEVGRYQVAYTVGSVVLLLLVSTGQAWMPRFAAVADAARRWELIGASRDQLMLLLVPALLGLTLAAPVALRLVAPASFRPAGLLVVVFLVALAAYPVADAVSTRMALLTLRRGRVLASSAAAAAALNVALNLVLVPTIGLVGSAAATVTAFALQAALHRRALRDVPGWPAVPATLRLQVALALLLCITSLLPPQSLALNLGRLALAFACLPWFVRRLLSARRTVAALSPG